MVRPTEGGEAFAELQGRAYGQTPSYAGNITSAQQRRA